MSPTLPTPSDPTAFTEAMTRAMQKAVRNALREHALLGRSVVTGRDGKAVWVPPDEVLQWLQATEELAAVGVVPPLGSFFQTLRKWGVRSRDQVENHAKRKGMSLRMVERWLAPNLAYDPE